MVTGTGGNRKKVLMIAQPLRHTLHDFKVDKHTAVAESDDHNEAMTTTTTTTTHDHHDDRDRDHYDDDGCDKDKDEKVMKTKTQRCLQRQCTTSTTKTKTQTMMTTNRTMNATVTTDAMHMVTQRLGGWQQRGHRCGGSPLPQEILLASTYFTSCSYRTH
jgi:hypothetical protein